MILSEFEDNIIILLCNTEIIQHNLYYSTYSY